MERIVSELAVREYLKRVREHQGLLCQHSLNVASLVGRMCGLLDFTRQEEKEILYGALYHDAGKLLVPASILNKPGELTELERDLLRRHPVVLPDELLDELQPLSKEIIRHHHEKPDGSGYPDGLTEIPIEVSIVTAADIYDAMRSPRSYKCAYSHVDVLRHMDKLVREGKLDKRSLDFLKAVTKYEIDKAASG